MVAFEGRRADEKRGKNLAATGEGAMPENGVAVDGAGDRLARAPETRDVEGERTFLRAVNAILNASKVRANKRVSVA